MPIKNGIIGFSFDKYPSSSIADAEVLKKAKKYKGNGSKCVSHLILRSKVDYDGLEIDNLKFNYLLARRPEAAYVVKNVLASDLENIVFIGSKETEKIVRMALYCFPESLSKNVEFVIEDEEPSLYNTIKKGREALNIKEGPIYFQAGDLPLLTDINPILHDPDAERYDLVIDLNSKERIFAEDHLFSNEYEFFKRNYYLAISEKKSKPYSFKEPNTWIFNPNVLDEKLVEFFTSTRKGGALTMARMLLFAFLRSKNKSRVLSMAPEGFYRSSIRPLFAKFFNCLFKKEYDTRKIFRSEYLEKLGEALIKRKVRVKVNHRDVNRLADIDSLEDWAYYEELFDYAINNKGGLGYIYPYAADMERFQKEYEEELKQVIPMYKDFPGFINSRFNTFRLPQPYHFGQLRSFRTKSADLERAVEHLHQRLLLRAEA